ncbi:MAG: hypothetical protein WD355_12695 [Balneolaceae bacterium]
MEIQFQGFSPVFSTLILVLLFVLSVGISWWSYATLSSGSPLKKWTLITLRGTALTILIILLLNPYIRTDQVTTRNPEIAVYLDDSRSMSVLRGDYRGVESYQELIDSFRFEEMEEITFQFYRFSNQVESLEDPQLSLEGSTTNLDEVIRHLRDQSVQAEAAVLFSDGIITQGRDPIFHARELSVPLFVVPVGDSTQARDIVLTDLLHNETGYLNTRHPVDITVSQNGFDGVQTELQLLKDGEILESRPITFSSELSTLTERFEIPLDNTGLQQYEFSTPVMDEEQTTENNRLPFAINVLDDKTRIAHISFEIHPDVGAIRNLIQSDQSFEVLSRTWLGDRFMEGPLDQIEESGELDLIILHGAIPNNLSGFQPLLEGVPVLQFTTPSFPSGDETSYVIPISSGQSGNTIPVYLRAGRDATAHPVMELPVVPFQRMSPIRSREGQYQLPPTADRLFEASFEGTDIELPVIVTEEAGSIRRTVVNGYGWYRNLQNREDEFREFTQTLLLNLASWTSTDPDHRNLRIEPVKRLFQESEPVRFVASLTNETGEIEPEAAIEVVLSGGQDFEQAHTMRNRSGGNYDLEIGSLGYGEYFYEATARKTGRAIDEQSGAFTVTESNIEFIQTQRSDERLGQLATITGGTTLQGDLQSQFLLKLEERQLQEAVEVRHSDYRYLFEHLFWFLLVTLLLTAEWILRRTAALP